MIGSPLSNVEKDTPAGVIVDADALRGVVDVSCPSRRLEMSSVGAGWVDEETSVELKYFPCGFPAFESSFDDSADNCESEIAMGWLI